MKNKLLLLSISLCLYLPGESQERIKLQSLYDALYTHHPLSKNMAIQRKITDEQLKLNNESRLPQTILSANASWQSEVTSLPIRLPNVDIPTPPHDQYRAVLDISQSIYDGGARKANQSLIGHMQSLENLQIETGIFNLRESVCKAYYAARLADLANSQLDLLIFDLKEKEKLLSQQIKEGLASGYQQAALEVKIIEAAQAKEDASKQKANAIAILQTLTGKNVTIHDQFIDPSNVPVTIRPEYKLLDVQKQLAIANNTVQATRFSPRLQAYTQLGYGRPSLNFLNNEFDPFAILGLRLQWNLSDIYLKNKNKQSVILQNNVEKINNQEKSLDQSFSVKADQYQKDISYYESLINQDDHVISLYEKVLASSKIRLEQGIATINDYTTDANNLTQAKIRKDQHQTLLIQSKEMYNLYQSTK